jgi:hypothetical protein
VADTGRVLLLAAAAVALIGVWAVGLSRLDLFTPGDVQAWRRLAAIRGYRARTSRLERAAARMPLLRRLQEELDLNRLLAIAGWAETPVAFLLRSLLFSLLFAAIILALLVTTLLTSGSWALPPWIAFASAAILLLLQFRLLQARATLRREQAGRSLGDMMMLVAIMTDGRGLQVEDAVRILSRCVDNATLQELVDRRGWQRLVRSQPATTIDLFRSIATEYRIPQFASIADAASNANVGLSEREVYTRVALTFYAQRLAEARFRAARAKTLVAIPIAGMLIPLLILIGAPVFAVITSALNG